MAGSAPAGDKAGGHVEVRGRRRGAGTRCRRGGHFSGTAVIARWLRQAWRRYREQAAGAAMLAA
ncbi:MAG: hypothetical protein WCF33_15005 [Pseudonocardiaceae bacterium]